MNRQVISRRNLLVFAGSAAALTSSSGWLGRAVAAPGTVVHLLTRPRNLITECMAFIAAKEDAKSPDAQLGSPTIGRPPGPRLRAVTLENLRASKAFYGVPARCRNDVLLKYAMLEEYQFRLFYSYCRRAFGSPEKRPFWEWYAQLDADIETYGVDVNPWWHDDAPKLPMIDGQRVEWRDGAWYADGRLLRRLLPPRHLV